MDAYQCANQERHLIAGSLSCHSGGPEPNQNQANHYYQAHQYLQVGGANYAHSYDNYLYQSGNAPAAVAAYASYESAEYQSSYSTSTSSTNNNNNPSTCSIETQISPLEAAKGANGEQSASFHVQAPSSYQQVSSTNDYYLASPPAKQSLGSVGSAHSAGQQAASVFQEFAASPQTALAAGQQQQQQQFAYSTYFRASELSACKGQQYAGNQEQQACLLAQQPFNLAGSLRLERPTGETSQRPAARLLAALPVANSQAASARTSKDSGGGSSSNNNNKSQQVSGESQRAGGLSKVRVGPLGVIARRKNATRETTATLKDWLDEHGTNPYPTKGEKIMLSIITKMSLTQVSTWFANARRRMKKENKAFWGANNKSGQQQQQQQADRQHNQQQPPGHSTGASIRYFISKHQKQLSASASSMLAFSGSHRFRGPFVYCQRRSQQQQQPAVGSAQPAGHTSAVTGGLSARGQKQTHSVRRPPAARPTSSVSPPPSSPPVSTTTAGANP